MKLTKKAFTLIEIIVAVTIFSIIMIVVIGVFVTASDINNKVEINRAMQSNIKHSVETIAEDIRLNGITETGNIDYGSGNFYKTGKTLTIGAREYYLAYYDDLQDRWIHTEDCSDVNRECSLVVNSAGEVNPLTNSWVQFDDIDFYVSERNMKKVTINFRAKPSFKKGVKPNLIKENTIDFQTTISEKIIDYKG